jgi:hypothetical protein
LFYSENRSSMSTVMRAEECACIPGSANTIYICFFKGSKITAICVKYESSGWIFANRFQADATVRGVFMPALILSRLLIA